jgi:predicted regulator of Ras-like GTPase activity (Roadblock/LC7/MglB family)
MSERILNTLGALRDVGGIQGSFVVSRSGALLAKDLPAVFDDGLFAVVGPRIARLHETLASENEGLAHVVMRFSEHKLHLRSAPFGFLCALSELGINVSALKMALTLVARRLEPEFAAGAAPRANALGPSSPPPPDERSTTLLSADFSALSQSAGPDSKAPPRSSRPPVTYRGRKL